MITIEFDRLEPLEARLAGSEGRIRQRLAAVMERLGVALQARVLEKLSGEVLQRRTGRLAAAQTLTLDGTGASAAVGFDPAEAPYGAIQEFGGATRAHLIAARRAFALRFSLAGRLVFAKRVQHPGSVIPAHSFLRSSLDEMAQDAVAAIAGAVSEGLGG